MCYQTPTTVNNSSKRHGSGINPATFYGCTTSKFLGDDNKPILLPKSSPEFRHLFAPSTEWSNFRKQQEVLDYISSTNCDLFPFTYQTNNGDRLFLAAHPIAFWFVDEQRPLKDRHNYEIIREFKPCKLYFDLEFNARINPEKNGHLMVKIFINLVCAALKCEFGISCDEKAVLNLDSSTEYKFSCHLIFPGIIFQNNYVTGYFVKQLCYELKSLLNESNLRLLGEAHPSPTLVESLFVDSEKGHRIFFCDEGVYTKNRHFRVYKSSKYGKNVALRLSEINVFPIEGADLASREKFIFLSSLITYCDGSDFRLLKFEPSSDGPTCWKQLYSKVSRSCCNVKNEPSTYKEIDDCVNNLVFPGRIHRATFFAENKLIVYDIVGNRFCQNIGRQHKSNNVMYVVSLSTLTYYQKCYDPNCADFKSESKKLPLSEDVFLKYDNDGDLLLAALEQSELDVSSNKSSSITSKNTNQNIVFNEQVSRKEENDEVNCGYEDEMLVAAAEQCEAVCSMDDWDLQIS